MPFQGFLSGGGQRRREATHSDRYPYLEADDVEGRVIRQSGYREINLLRAVRHIIREDTCQELSPYLRRVLYTPLPDVEEDEYKPILEAWVQVFDQMFFFGLVSPNVRIRIRVNRSRPGLFGSWSQEDCHNINIYLHNGHPLPSYFTGSRLEWYLATVLHEMTHAFIIMYSCDCRDCQEERRIENGGSGHNADGHGPLWAEAMTIIQQALQRHVRWQVVCGIRDSVTASMERYGWAASSSEAARWFQIEY